jgi:putative NADH-flavin reductase
MAVRLIILGATGSLGQHVLRRALAAGHEVSVLVFLAGAALLDIDASGRRGVDIPQVSATYWPHRVNFERLQRSRLDWRLLCPGPMVEQPALGVGRLRITLDQAS